MEINPHDLQTAQVLQGVILIINNCPEAKLLLGYDQNIIVALPYGHTLSEDISEVLKRWGWYNRSTLTHIWDYKVEGSVYDYYSPVR